MDNKRTQLSTNQLVLIRQPNLTPLQWAMGRIQEIHLGLDSIACTAIVKTAKGFFGSEVTLNYQYYQFKPSLCVIKHLD